ncbi:hypothetical protein EJB05_11665, partial [Eragrostis curvula]
LSQESTIHTKRKSLISIPGPSLHTAPELVSGRAPSDAVIPTTNPVAPRHKATTDRSRCAATLLVRTGPVTGSEAKTLARRPDSDDELDTLFFLGEKAPAHRGQRPYASSFHHHYRQLLHCTRDWANLGRDGPTGLIAELALGRDVADYVCFRAVCRPWRRCSPAPHDLPGGVLDRRLFPRRWIMLDTAFSDHRRHRFFNVFTGKWIRMDLPELDDHHTLLAVTPEGLLLMLHEPTLVVRLLNPLTRQLIDLPPVTPLLPPHLPLRLWVDGVGVTDDSTVAVASTVASEVESWFWIPQAFPSVTADTLYLGFDCWEKGGMSRIDGYNLADGSSEPSYYDSDDDNEMVQPCSIIDCLSHCIQGSGDQLE